MLPKTALSNFMQSFATHLLWAMDFVLHKCFNFSKADFAAAAAIDDFSGEIGGIRLHNSSNCNQGGGGGIECSICLFEIEEGHEIRELNCGHSFHRVCLDRWVRHGQITCPLCRRYLRLPPLVTDQSSQEVPLLFKFCSFGSSRRGSDSWWLR